MLKIRILLIFIIFMQSCVHTNLHKVSNSFEYKKVLSDTSKTYIYRASLNLYDNDFSGIIIIKPQANNNRIVFINEIGMKFFDFEFSKETYKVNYIFKPLNKKVFVKLLINDFRFILMNNLKKSNDFYKYKKTEFNVVKPKNKKVLYFFNKDNLFPTKGIKFSILRRIVFLSYNKYINEVPHEIKIRHKNIKFEMKMEFIR